ncbi:MAG TPA: hypothetical protein VKV27_08305 [Solirubrobacteraceae bacterium]|nr:hypothetical protein [Solirubrobacteraceae bacterium]
MSDARTRRAGAGAVASLRTAAVAGALLLLTLCASAARAATPSITEYPATPSSFNFGINPYEIAAGPDGNLWYTDGGADILQMTVGGQASSLSAADPSAFTTGIVSAYGALWYTDEGNSSIGCIGPSGSPSVEFTLPSFQPGNSTYAGLDGITVGPDGNLWFVEAATNTIGTLAPSRSAPCQLADGASACDAATCHEYPVPGATLATTAGGNVATDADNIAAGPGGNLWFAESGSARIGEMTTSGQVVGSFPAPPASLNGYPLGIAKGPDGNMWFTEGGNGQTIGRVTPSGSVTQFKLGSAYSALWSIVAGPDGNMWFTDGSGVGCITTGGAAAQYPSPSGSAADGITVGPDGAIWFAENIASKIGRLSPVTCTASSPPSGGGTGTAPTSTSAPVISGTARPGHTLRCSTGSWAGSPTGFSYRWYRNGTPLALQTGPTYRVGDLDEGTTLICVVSAANAGGSASAASRADVVPVPVVPRCPAATGRMTQTTIGQISLGMTRARARFLYRRHADRGRRYVDFFCLTPIGVRAGYASPRLLAELAPRERRLYRDRVVWASTSNPHYSLDGVRPGEAIAAAAAALHAQPPLRVGLNYWYLARLGAGTAVLKVRGSVVQELGIAVDALTATRRLQSILMHSFY